jgi:hypothetical protein
MAVVGVGTTIGFSIGGGAIFAVHPECAFMPKYHWLPFFV